MKKQSIEKSAKGRTSTECFDDFLAEQNLLAEAEDVAIKRVLAWQTAKCMKTASCQLDCLPAPENK